MGGYRKREERNGMRKMRGAETENQQRGSSADKDEWRK